MRPYLQRYYLHGRAPGQSSTSGTECHTVLVGSAAFSNQSLRLYTKMSFTRRQGCVFRDSLPSPQLLKNPLIRCYFIVFFALIYRLHCEIYSYTGY